MGSEHSHLEKNKTQQQLFSSFDQQFPQSQAQQQINYSQQQNPFQQQYAQASSYQQYQQQQQQQQPQQYQQQQQQSQQHQQTPTPPPQAPQITTTPPTPAPNAQNRHSMGLYTNQHYQTAPAHLSNLQRMMHISASNPQLNVINSRRTPPTPLNNNNNNNNLTPVTTPSLPQNKTYMNNNPVFTFQDVNLPVPGYSNRTSDDLNNDGPILNKSLSRHVSETNVYQKPAVLENLPNALNNNITGNNRQKLLVLRHGERVDTTFGPNWVESCFDNTGRYNRFNLNMPKTLPHRDNPKYEYLYDPPLTEMGMHQAKLTGEELASQGITISHCYCSPALRSIQTADKVLEGMGLKNTVPIKVEIGLYEFLRWQASVPAKYPFMDLRSLVAAGYNIDLSYSSLVAYEMLRFDENEEGYYQRSYFMTKTITDRHITDGGNMMFVGHAPSLEVCTRQLCGGEPRVTDFRNVIRKVPFLAIAQCERNPVSQKWKLKKPPIPALKHLSVDEFDWKNLQNRPMNENTPYMYLPSTPPANVIPRQAYVPAWRV